MPKIENVFMPRACSNQRDPDARLPFNPRHEIPCVTRQTLSARGSLDRGIEYVQLRQSDLRRTIQLNSPLRQVKVKRCRSPLSSSNGPVLHPTLSQYLIPVQLPLQRSLSHTRHIRLENHHNIIYLRRTNSNISTSLRRSGILRSHERIRTMIETEKGPLGPFHVDPLAARQ